MSVPTGLWTAATLDALVSGVGSGDVTFKFDVGNNGTWDWEETQTIANAGTFSSPDLAAAFANYVGGTGDKDVEVKVYLSKPGQVLLTNMAVTRNRSVELAPGFTLSGTPTEGTTVPLNVTLTNNGAVDSGPLTVSYYAAQPQADSRNSQSAIRNSYIGSVFVPNIPAGGSTPASFDWNTLGFTGPVTVTAVVDPYNRLAETDETNNSRPANLTIRTRPDLHVTAITLSDDEPVAGQAVEVVLHVRNDGQTAANTMSTALLDGAPGSGTTVGEQANVEIGAGGTGTLSFTWIPNKPGYARLYAEADTGNTVNEFDEGNNGLWRDVYVGLAAPITLDSGAVDEAAYIPDTGYGFVDTGQPDEQICNSAPDESARWDPSGPIHYRFDHLLPGHFYHLDLTLWECDYSGRIQTVFVDGNPISAGENLSDGEVHRLSLLLDPALYADRSISVTVAADHSGALVNRITLHDVDYRYADSGASADPTDPRDPQYPGALGFGWLDGVRSIAAGTLPYRSDRRDTDADVRYRFDNLHPDKDYLVHLTFWLAGGVPRTMQIAVDGDNQGAPYTIQPTVRQDVSIAVPRVHYYDDGSIDVRMQRLDAPGGAFVNTIALEERTVAPANPCVVEETPNWTEIYGALTLDDRPAPVGTVVQALNPRGETVGCFAVNASGQYGFMRIYGEDSSANPVVPGMRAGETVDLRVDGNKVALDPPFVWQADRARHQTNLDAQDLANQSLLVRPGWNLLSFFLKPPLSQPAQVLRSLAGRYDRVLGDGTIYDPALTDTYNTLNALTPGQAYYVRSTAGSTVNALVDGVRVPVNTPRSLVQGWNWIGYLPRWSLPVADALHAIEGKYKRVLGISSTYDTDLPSYSTLTRMEPGQGYLIYMTTAATLVYPEVDAARAQPAPLPAISQGCDNLAPTPALTLVYGDVRVGGQAAAPGTKVEAFAPDGTLAGCFVVQNQGEFGLMHVYGAWTEEEAGLRAGDPMVWRVNGVTAQAGEAILWQDDRTPHRLELDGVHPPLFLPWIHTAPGVEASSSDTERLFLPSIDR
jgi:hypothetical protein